MIVMSKDEILHQRFFSVLFSSFLWGGGGGGGGDRFDTKAQKARLDDPRPT